jgi:hypothetical protein
MSKPRYCILVVTLLVAPAGAQEVYKSVGPDGAVSYSSTPPAQGDGVLVEEVPIAPGPSEAERREAEQRVQAIDRELNRTEQARQEQAAQGQGDSAGTEQALQQARSALEQAKVQRLDDWQYLSSGGRVLKQSYLDRVQRAEQAVKAAEDAVRKARAGR